MPLVTTHPEALTASAGSLQRIGSAMSAQNAAVVSAQAVGDPNGVREHVGA
jgi:hypothetical protein